MNYVNNVFSVKFKLLQGFNNKTSFPDAGFAGIFRAKMRETIAIAEPAKKTSDGEFNQTSPKATGIKTAAI